MRSRLVAVLLGFVSVALAAQGPQLPPVGYTEDGGIPVPDYDKWVFIGAGAFETAETAPAPRFSNIFVAADAYDAFMASGVWPDRTVIFSEKRAGLTTMPLTKNPGWGQTGEPLGFEFEVKDQKTGGWRYYTAGAGERVGRPVKNQADCTTCHAQHAAADNTFVQFYPKLAAAAKRHGSFRADSR